MLQEADEDKKKKKKHWVEQIYLICSDLPRIHEAEKYVELVLVFKNYGKTGLQDVP